MTNFASWGEAGRPGCAPSSPVGWVPAGTDSWKKVKELEVITAVEVAAEKRYAVDASPIERLIALNAKTIESAADALLIEKHAVLNAKTIECAADALPIEKHAALNAPIEEHAVLNAKRIECAADALPIEKHAALNAKRI